MAARRRGPACAEGNAPGRTSPAHEGDALAEMVCSNSFRSDDAEKRRRPAPPGNAALGSLIMAPPTTTAFQPVGARRRSRSVRRRGHPRRRGPSRTSPSSASGSTGCPIPDDHRHRPADRKRPRRRDRRRNRQPTPRLLDAIAPIVHRDSIDMDVCWMAAGGTRAARTTSTARWTGSSTRHSSPRSTPAKRPSSRNGKGHALLRGLHADRGDGRARETLRYGPMKPVGLDNPHPNPGAGLMRWSSCDRTTSSAPCGTWSASRPS